MKKIPIATKAKLAKEKKLLKEQPIIEKRAQELFLVDKEAAKEYLTDYTFKLLNEKR